MQPYCKYNDKSKRCVTWFNQVCADCRSQFPKSGVNQRLKDGGQKSKAGLISAEECYRLIKRSTELLATDGYDKDEVWWKVPLILLVLGCILVLSIVTCLICQKVVKTVQERMSQHVDFNVCESKRNPTFAGEESDPHRRSVLHPVTSESSAPSVPARQNRLSVNQPLDVIEQS